MDAMQEALSLLPERLATPLSICARHRNIHEIRLRLDLPLSVTVRANNLLLDESGRVCTLSRALICRADELRHVVSRLCDGSVYRHVDTLRRGYVVTPFGLRAGLCSRAPKDSEGRVRASLSDFTGINLRIPHNVASAAADLVAFYREHGLYSTLVYSPPGEGKTTLLRALALAQSRGEGGAMMRVSVIDERGELFASQSSFAKDAGLLDVLTGYAKAEGIETATRLFSPQVIVCDELGEEDEVRPLLDAQRSGVYLVASVHASSVEDLYAKPQVRDLLQAGLFDLTCRVGWDDVRRGTKTQIERVS
ncbi:MAG: hypothetical protein IJF24_01260 [Clostridia bacterium]|nr:hypothetical protein [Clostridia bacterium]